MRYSKSLPSVGLLMLGVAACDVMPPGVESPGGDPSALVLSPVAMTLIGEDDVFRVAGAVPTTSGFLIFENRDPRMRVVARQGNQERVIDVLGDGPGEFREVTSVSMTAGDSIVVFDGGARRVSVFTSDGEFARSLQLTGSDRPILGALRPTGLGWLVIAGSRVRPGEGRAGSFRPPGELLLFDPDGEFRGVVRAVAGPEIFFGETGGFLRPLLPRRSEWDVVGEHLLLTNGDEFLLQDIAIAGAKERKIVLLETPPIISGEEHDTILDSLGASLSSAGLARIRSTYEVTSLPERMPAYGGIVSTRAGSAWVGSYADPREDHRIWTLFNVEDELITGRIELPRSANVLWASEDEMIAVVTDTLGAERVVHIVVGEGG